MRQLLDPLTHRIVKRPLGEPGATVSTAQLGKKPSSDVPVLWWSSRAVRLAQQRVRELRDPAAPRKPLRAAPLDGIVIVVEGSEPLRILHDASENLKDTVYLELPDGLPLDVTNIEFHEGQEAGDDFTAFYFPRTMEGRPTLTPETGPVIFRCKATASGRPGTLQIRAPFDTRKMRYLSQPDL